METQDEDNIAVANVKANNVFGQCHQNNNMEENRTNRKRTKLTKKI